MYSPVVFGTMWNLVYQSRTPEKSIAHVEQVVVLFSYKIVKWFSSDNLKKPLR